jgi:hypothetical protein
MFNKQPPELLRTFYARLACHYGTAGMWLLGIPGRWLVFRTADLTARVERTIIVIGQPPPHTVENLAVRESRAACAVGDDHDATLIAMHLGQPVMLNHDGMPRQPCRPSGSRCGAWHTPWH